MPRNPDNKLYGRKGPQTAEARQRASEAAKMGWKLKRTERMKKFNEGKGDNTVRALRLKCKNKDGTPMTQNDFAHAIGLSKGNAQRISQFENGLKPQPILLAEMKRLAEAQGISWSYEQG